MLRPATVLTVSCDFLMGRCTGPSVGLEGVLAGILVVKPLRLRHGDRGIGMVRFCGSRTTRHMIQVGGTVFLQADLAISTTGSSLLVRDCCHRHNKAQSSGWPASCPWQTGDFKSKLLILVVINALAQHCSAQQHPVNITASYLVHMPRHVTHPCHKATI